MRLKHFVSVLLVSVLVLASCADGGDASSSEVPDRLTVRHGQARLSFTPDQGSESRARVVVEPRDATPFADATRVSALSGPVDFHLDTNWDGTVQIEIPLADNVDGDAAVIVHYYASEEVWVPEPGTRYVADQHSVVADVSELSLFDVLADAGSWVNYQTQDKLFDNRASEPECFGDPPSWVRSVLFNDERNAVLLGCVDSDGPTAVVRLAVNRGFSLRLTLNEPFQVADTGSTDLSAIVGARVAAALDNALPGEVIALATEDLTLRIEQPTTNREIKIGVRTDAYSLLGDALVKAFLGTGLPAAAAFNMFECVVAAVEAGTATSATDRARSGFAALAGCAEIAAESLGLSRTASAALHKLALGLQGFDVIAAAAELAAESKGLYQAFSSNHYLPPSGASIFVRDLAAPLVPETVPTSSEESFESDPTDDPSGPHVGDSAGAIRLCTTGVGTHETLNLRSGPALTAEIVGSVVGGSCSLQTANDGGDWVWVTASQPGFDQTIDGFVFGKFVDRPNRPVVADIHGLAPSSSGPGVALGVPILMAEGAMRATLGAPESIETLRVCGDSRSAIEWRGLWPGLRAVAHPEQPFGPGTIEDATLTLISVDFLSADWSVAGLSPGDTWADVQNRFPSAVLVESVWGVGWSSHDQADGNQPIQGSFESDSNRHAAADVSSSERIASVVVGSTYADC